MLDLNPHAGDECPGELNLIEAKHHTTGLNHPTLGEGDLAKVNETVAACAKGNRVGTYQVHPAQPPIFDPLL